MEKTYHFWVEWWCKEEFRYIVNIALEFYPMSPLFLRKFGCQHSDGKCLAHWCIAEMFYFCICTASVITH